MKSKIIISVLIVASFIFSACDKFLDQMPDNRIENMTVRQIQRLLVNAYMGGNYATMCELSADNLVDNQSPDEKGIYFNLAEREIWHNEAFAWKDIVSAADNQDSPTYVWDACYNAIAVANNALDQIEKLEQAGTPREETASVKGEALLCRAYHHFLLVNIFSQAYRNDNLSKNDLGIPYITKPETKVLVDYERGNVTDVYNQIEKDLLEGLSLADGSYYTVPKYHFNIKAANAFAARFYLYKRNYQKVIEYASVVLGEARTMMRNWDAETPTSEACGLWWTDTKSNNNLMLVSTASWASRIFGSRYSCNREASKATFYGAGPTWDTYNFHPCYDSRLYYRGNQEYGLFFLASACEFFEYTDKIAGIGVGHIIRPEFTAEETLLCRAEAYFFQNRIADAVADLKVMDDSRKVIKDAETGTKIPEKELTEQLIRTFYTQPANAVRYTNVLNTEQMSPDWTVNANNKAILDCILHYRRHETIFNGLRWFDIKRFGIEITHKIGKTSDSLKWNDSRRALQLPPEAVVAGLTPNDRSPQLGLASGNGGIYKADVSYVKITDKEDNTTTEKK